jgi:methylmalonyl-CoA mutase cobalamin-binding domain/chain
VVIGGGIIPTEDIAEMKSVGIRAIFQPETITTEIIDYINNDIMETKNKPS